MMRKLKDLIVLFNDVKNTKTKKRYIDLLDFANELINDVLVNDYSNIEKTLLKTIVEEIINYNSAYPCLEKKELLRSKVSLILVCIKDLDDLINCMLISKIDDHIVVGNTFYSNSYDLYYDLRNFILNKNKAPKRVREKVNAYIYYVASSLLSEIEKYDFEVEEADKSLIWILKQIVNTELYINAFETNKNDEKIEYREYSNLYLRLINYR